MQILMFPSVATRFLLFATEGTVMRLLLRLRFVNPVVFCCGFDKI